MLISVWKSSDGKYFCNYEISDCPNTKIIEVSEQELEEIMTCTYEKVNQILENLYWE